ncbi:MAG: hypothetical protein M3396_02255 [Actinomycetota bacterium]|nr:hypothetical protein [Actinomycetota bacterium]MDQ3573928.1 hypothetical protein [Actinomycetota bacterium]
MGGDGGVLDAGEGIEVLVRGGWVVDCWGLVVVVGCDARVEGVGSAVVLVGRGAVVGTGAGNGEAGTYT